MQHRHFNGLAVALAAASLFLGDLLSVCAQAGEPTIVWQLHEGKNVVRVQGLAVKANQWSEEQWRRAFTISVEPKDFTSSMNLPSMLGSYEIGPDAVTFSPKYPLAAGLTYRATLRPNSLPGYPSKPSIVSVTHTIPKVIPAATTVVEAVYPSADVLPENLLKFYLHFSAPMSGGHIYEHIHLLNSDGKPVQLPFLEIDEELWNPEMTRLTLFIDPGRIKREVKPLEEIGPALETGKSYTLVIDSVWQDGQGAPLKASFRKQFKVSPPDREPPDPKTWKIKPAAAKSQKPLSITFPKPMDHALAQRLIWVTDEQGKHIAGDISLDDHEKRWLFTPREPWTSGRYKLNVQTTIEDLAGNNIGKPFEVDLFEKVEKRIDSETLTIPFTVK